MDIFGYALCRKNKGGAPGGGGAKSWNDLADKPFYEATESVVIFERERLAGGPMLLDSEGTKTLKVSDLVAGDTYIVTVDGVDYTGVAEQYEDTSCDDGIGIRLFNKGEYPTDFSDAPISIGSYSNDLYADFESGRHSVKITHVKSELKTLDPQFLPEPLRFGEKGEDIVLVDTRFTQDPYNYDADEATASIEVQNEVELREGMVCHVVYSGGAGDFDGEVVVGKNQGFSFETDLNPVSFRVTGSRCYLQAWGTNISGRISVTVLGEITKINPEYLPKAAKVADVTDAPTAEQFNALLASLRAAGYLNK